MLPHRAGRRAPACQPKRPLPARRSLTFAVVALGVLGLVGCASGPGNETSLEHTVLQGTDTSVGSVDIQDIYVTAVGEEVTPAATGATLGPTSTATGSAPPEITTASPTSSSSVSGYLVATFTDNSKVQPDALVGISAVGPVSAGSSAASAAGSNLTVNLVPSGSKVDMQTNGSAFLRDPAASQTGPFAVLSGATAPLQIGDYVKVTFDLQNAGASSTVEVPIIESFAGTPPATPPGVTAKPAPSQKTSSPAAAPTNTTTASP